MNRLGYYFVGLVVIFGLVLSACAVPQKSATTPSPQKPSAASPAVATPQLSREQKLVEGAKKEGVVVWWVFSGGEAVTQVLKPFREKYPFLEVKTFDTRGPEIALRITEEAKAGRHSVDAILLSEKDFLPPALWKELVAEHEWPNTKSWSWLRGHDYYRIVSASFRGTSYNTSLLTASEAPKSWEDLNSTRWRGKSVTSVSLNDIPLYFAHVWGQEGKLNWDKSFSFWREVVVNARPRVMSGQTGPQEMLAAGEFAVYIMGSLGGTLELIAKGAPLEMASSLKVPITPIVLAIPKNAPHPNAARLLVDYLTSEEGLVINGNARFHVVPSSEAARRVRANRELARRGVMTDEVPLQFATPENYKRSNDFWLDLLGRPS